MKRKTAVGVGAGATAGFFSSMIAAEEWLRPDEPKPLDLDEKISIHVPTLNEEKYIEETLISLISQPYYRFTEDVDLVLVDSHSEDQTVKLAEQYVDEVYMVPKGKLTARNEAVKRDDSGIIVNVDAGAYYPKYWLSHLLKPFEKKEVVATMGYTLSKDPMWKPIKLLSSMARPIHHLSGHNSAISRQAFIDMGGFKTDLDESDFDQVWKEEEVAFLHRIKTQGKVKFVPKALMYESPRRRPFSLVDNDKDYKEKIKCGERF